MRRKRVKEDEGRRWVEERRAANQRLAQIAQAAREVRFTHAMRVLATIPDRVSEGTPTPVVVRLGVRFKDDGR